MTEPIEKKQKETGRTKGQKEHKSNEQPWEHCERESSRFLATHDGKDESIQYKFLQSNLGRVGEHSALGFDSVSIHYCGETKMRSKVAAFITDGWRQLCGLSIIHKKAPCLFLWIRGVDPYITVQGKKVLMPNPLHCLDKKRHAQLLCKEKIADNVESLLHDIYYAAHDYVLSNDDTLESGWQLAAKIEDMVKSFIEKPKDDDA